jgi:ribosomal protein L24E
MESKEKGNMQVAEINNKAYNTRSKKKGNTHLIKMIKPRRMRWVGHVARMRDNRNSYGGLVGKRKGNIPLGRPRRGRKDNMKMDLRE